MIIQKGAHVGHLISFAQWQYHNRWGSPEVWLLLVENFNQYPATMKWNILRRRQFLIAPIGACILIEIIDLSKARWYFPPLRFAFAYRIMFYINKTPNLALTFQFNVLLRKVHNVEKAKKKQYANCIPYSQAVNNTFKCIVCYRRQWFPAIKILHCRRYFHQKRIYSLCYFRPFSGRRNTNNIYTV